MPISTGRYAACTPGSRRAALAHRWSWLRHSVRLLLARPHRLAPEDTGTGYALPVPGVGPLDRTAGHRLALTPLDHPADTCHPGHRPRRSRQGIRLGRGPAGHPSLVQRRVSSSGVSSVRWWGWCCRAASAPRRPWGARGAGRLAFDRCGWVPRLVSVSAGFGLITPFGSDF
jgi:hypothetical protein